MGEKCKTCKHDSKPWHEEPCNSCCGAHSGYEPVGDMISRQAAIDALWKALYEYEDKAEKQFQESDDLDVGEWLEHRVFVQNMNDIDRKTILELPSAQPEIIYCKDCKYMEAHHYEESGEPPYIKYTCSSKWGLQKGYQIHDWDFCSRAERREDGKND